VSGGPFVAQPYNASDPDVKVSDMQAALNPVIEVLLANSDTITADEDVGMLITGDDTSLEIIGNAL
jgi:hypothetical protein